MLLVTLGLIGCSRTPNFEMTSRWKYVQSNNGCWFQCGGIFLKEASPGVLFGMAKELGGNRELIYLVIFKHRASAKSQVGTRSNLIGDASQV